MTWYISVDCWVLIFLPFLTVCCHSHSVSVGPYIWVSCDSEQLPSRNTSEQIAKQLSNHIKSGVLCSLYLFHDSHTHTNTHTHTQWRKWHDRLHRDKAANVEWLKHYESERWKENVYNVLHFIVRFIRLSLSLSSFVLLLCVYRFSLDFVHSSDLSRTSNRIVWP